MYTYIMYVKIIPKSREMSNINCHHAAFQFSRTTAIAYFSFFRSPGSDYIFDLPEETEFFFEWLNYFAVEVNRIYISTSLNKVSHNNSLNISPLPY